MSYMQCFIIRTLDWLGNLFIFNDDNKIDEMLAVSTITMHRIVTRSHAMAEQHRFYFSVAPAQFDTSCSLCTLMASDRR